MSIIHKILGITNDETRENLVKMGRYSDSYKNDEKYDRWDEAVKSFESRNYITSFEYFFDYLKDKDENVKWWFQDKKLHFRIYQGSKIIRGHADNKTLFAEAKIAKTNSLEIGFLRRLLEKNYSLKYTRYSLDDQHDISMVFVTGVIDASPYKLYYALKELATHVDKEDDLLIEEFSCLEHVNDSHIIPIDISIKKAKTKYLYNSIDDVMQLLEQGKLNLAHYPGAESYVLLELAYRLDFFIKPEGYVMEKIESIHQMFFGIKKINAHNNNLEIRRALKCIRDRSEEEIHEELYNVLSTFGITSPAGHEQLTSFIDAELSNMDWYYKNDHQDIALAVPGYIVGYMLFNFSLPAPDRDFLLLYLSIYHSDFFQSMGANKGLVINGVISPNAIKSAISRIKKVHHEKYPSLDPDVSSLNFTDKALFAKSFLLMLRNVSLHKKIQR